VRAGFARAPRDWKRFDNDLFAAAQKSDGLARDSPPMREASAEARADVSAENLFIEKTNVP